MRSQPAPPGLNQPSFSKARPRSIPDAVPALPCPAAHPPQRPCDRAPMSWWLPATQSIFPALFSQEEFSAQILWDAPRRRNLGLSSMKFHPLALVLAPKVIHAFSHVPEWQCQCPCHTRALLKGILGLGSPRRGQRPGTSWIHGSLPCRRAPSTGITFPAISDNCAGSRSDFCRVPG